MTGCSLRRYDPHVGYTRIIERGELGIVTLDFGIVRLDAWNAFFEDTADDEVGLVVLSGRCELLVGHNGNKAHGLIGERADVFAGEAYRAYIPHRTTYEIVTHDAPVEVAVCKVPSHLETAAIILAPGDALEPNEHGLIASERRPHSSPGEAVGFYRFSPASGHANLHISSDDGSLDQTVKVRDNDVLALPKGHHADCGAVGGRVYCLWMTSGERVTAER